MAERLVVVGGDAGGMTAAAQARRRNDAIEIVALERGNWTSYSACGIPYLVSGAVGELAQLVARSPQEFRARFRIDVRLRHEVMGIDLDARKVEVRDHGHDRTFTVGFDQLLIGTGARPRRPPLPGIDGDHVHGVQTLDDAAHLLEHAADVKSRNVVVVGGGYIGLEIAEAFVERGARVTVVEASPQLMGTLDPEVAAVIADAMKRMGIDVRLGLEVTGFEPRGVRTEDGTIVADLVVLGLGVVPNGELAGAAGIELGVAGAVRVDRRQRTSADGVWAAGDCCESFHLVSQRDVYVPLGTVANKQSRVAGINVVGGYATFPGVLGTAVTRVCDTEVARTGLNEREATEAGFGYTVASIESTTRAGYLPTARPMTVKMLAEERSGRVLGAQIVGGPGAAKRIDVVAMALAAGMSAHDIVDADLGYAPPFGPLWDPVQVAARRLVDRADRRGSGGG